mmetsp:Transcript_7306/g.17814  ORF Transcript_7306/g.17814 Transcript_7306/m.17814 type:complete len:209 (+) Transcript_7306:2322-2948(+)
MRKLPAPLSLPFSSSCFSFNPSFFSPHSLASSRRLSSPSFSSAVATASLSPVERPSSSRSQALVAARFEALSIASRACARSLGRRSDAFAGGAAAPADTASASSPSPAATACCCCCFFTRSCWWRFVCCRRFFPRPFPSSTPRASTPRPLPLRQRQDFATTRSSSTSSRTGRRVLSFLSAHHRRAEDRAAPSALLGAGLRFIIIPLIG